MNGTFPYYSDGVVGESYGAGNFKATNGRLYKVSTSGEGTPLAWYPAPGFRAGSHGALGNVSEVGFSWSSAFYDLGDYYRGTYLNFSTQYLYPNDANVRVSGFPLRCLSE